MPSQDGPERAQEGREGGQEPLPGVSPRAPDVVVLRAGEAARTTDPGDLVGRARAAVGAVVDASDLRFTLEDGATGPEIHVRAAGEAGRRAMAEYADAMATFGFVPGPGMR